MKRLAFILAAVALAGCSSVQICREGGHDMCCVRTSGWKLFNCIPFVSGNPEGWCCRFFSDTVKVETNIALLDKTIRDGDYGSVSNLTSHVTEEPMLPLLLKRVVCHTSAELIPREASER
ncbi:MAG: hypothetical protein IKA69_02020 [Kiritimatiellae bacterium]|nr:hypothetical protein [Kiritimatiellia bacterium]MBR2938665.1 hypothetical protein [Kiritimatiellia bacterium]